MPGTSDQCDFALKRLGVEARITDDHDEICCGGQGYFSRGGEASTTMKYLKERELGFLLRDLKQPVLGNLSGPPVDVCCIGRGGYRLHRDL